MTHRRIISILFIPILVTLALVAGGCGMAQSGMRTMPGAPPMGPDELRLETRNNAVVAFQDGGYTLTWSGVSGPARIWPSDGILTQKDTTVSWFDISSAAGTGRSKTTGQFLLTVLGVILVIGLAAIVLYAAFLATDR